MAEPEPELVHAALRPGPLDVAAVAGRVRTHADGAVCCFTGHVRGEADGTPVTALEYDCYDAMAVEEMRRIARGALAAGASRVAVEHRTGRVPAGEPAVVVAVAAPHRAQAFDACRQVIDAVKREVPIWKQEHREGGSMWVEEGVTAAAGEAPEQPAVEHRAPPRDGVVAAALSHVDASGGVCMVDISSKPAAVREAVAEGEVRCDVETARLIATGSAAKGDVLATARIAGIMAAKRTAELIPLCHPLALTHVDVEATSDLTLPGVRLRAAARCTGPTGVEMEALTAVTVAGLTVIDMAKSADRWMSLDGVGLVRKEGGRSGLSRRPASRPRAPGQPVRADS